MLSLCESTNVFPDAFFFCYSKIHFHPLGSFKLIKTMLKSLKVCKVLSHVWNRYPKGSHKTWAT